MSSARTAGALASPATVLLVDGDEAQGDRVQAIIERAGHQVLRAVEGAAALRLLSAHECDLVLTETELPDMDGLDVCRAIKEAPATRDTPVLVLIQADDEVQRQRALQAGADDVSLKPVDAASLLPVIRSQLRIGRLTVQVSQLEGALLTLARAVEDRDQSSSGLGEKVAHWARQLGGATGLSNDSLTVLYKAALLHDVGSVGVPVAVLSKEARLDPGEFTQVKRHPVMGEEILRALPQARDVLPAIRHHHERVDGAGYPDGIGGDAIPVFARIIAIADAFVAITSDRPYRQRRSKQEAMEILRQGAGKQWDAELVQRFLSLLEAAGADAASRLKTG